MADEGTVKIRVAGFGGLTKVVGGVLLRLALLPQPLTPRPTDKASVGMRSLLTLALIAG